MELPPPLRRQDRKMSKWELRQLLEKEVEKEPKPEGEELEEQFREVIAEMVLPKEQHEQMLALDAEKKWDIIKAQKIFAKHREGGIDKDQAEKWVVLLKKRTSGGTPLLTMENARELDTALRTGQKSFLVEFVKAQGLAEINSVVEYFAHITDRSEERLRLMGYLVSMYRALLNNNIGMEAAISTRGEFLVSFILFPLNKSS